MPSCSWTIKFNIVEKKMFNDELRDLVLVYKAALEGIDQDLRENDQYLLYYMKEFVKLRENRSEVSEKLNALLDKMDGKNKEGCDDE